MPLSQLAIAWCAANPNVSSVITGATKESHVRFKKILDPLLVRLLFLEAGCCLYVLVLFHFYSYRIYDFDCLLVHVIEEKETHVGCGFSCLAFFIFCLFQFVCICLFRLICWICGCSLLPVAFFIP